MNRELASIKQIMYEALKVDLSQIKNIRPVKLGMTNRSYTVQVGNEFYIVRLPGEGTEKLINRTHEKQVYDAIKGKGLCDDPIFFDQTNGVKISKYLHGARTCDSASKNDLLLCMRKLHYLHDLEINMGYDFDLFENIDRYEALWGRRQSIYSDYPETKDHVLYLKHYIDEQPVKHILCHIDSVPDNFLFYIGNDGCQKLQLTDWEYASMNDPYVDLAMFCIYSGFSKNEADSLMDYYFECDCPDAIRTRIYAYMSICGLLWSNWCEYKASLGIHFGKYSRQQYDYARDFYKLAKERVL